MPQPNTTKRKADMAQIITLMITRVLELIPKQEKLPFEIKMANRSKQATKVYIHNTGGTKEINKLVKINKTILATNDLKLGKEILDTRLGLCILISLLPADVFATQYAVLQKEAWNYYSNYDVPNELLLQGIRYIVALQTYYNIKPRGTKIYFKKIKVKKEKRKSKKKPRKKKKTLSSSVVHRIREKKIIAQKLASGEFDPTENTQPTSLSASAKLKQFIKKAKEAKS
jgi:hypothetical protein